METSSVAMETCKLTSPGGSACTIQFNLASKPSPELTHDLATLISGGSGKQLEQK